MFFCFYCLFFNKLILYEYSYTTLCMHTCFHLALVMVSVICNGYPCHGGKWDWMELRIEPGDILLEISL